MTSYERGLLDTSVLIASEAGRQLADDELPAAAAISTVTLAELRLGVLAARDVSVQARRLDTLDNLSTMLVLYPDERAAAYWAELRVHLLREQRAIGANDLWIAATALAHGLPLFTQDDGFAAVDGVAGLQVVAV